MHKHPPQRGSGHRALVGRSQESCGNSSLSHDAILQTIQHLVHQKWYLAAISKQPQVYDELAVRFLVIVVRDAARVEPGDEALESLGVLGVEPDCVVFCCCPSAAEGGLEVSGIESQEAAVDVESALVVAAPDDNGGLGAVR